MKTDIYIYIYIYIYIVGETSLTKYKLLVKSRNKIWFSLTLLISYKKS
jgi:hypothetical protein